MKLLVITTHFPYGTWNEAFFETEFHKLASSFDEIHLLPLKSGPLNRTLPPNVVLWEPVASAGKWSHARQLLHFSTWRMLAESLNKCRHAVGRIGRRHVINCLATACWRSALERHERLKAFVKSGTPAVVYAYWGHMPAQAIPVAKALGAKTCVRYHRVDLYLETINNEGFIPGRDEVQAAADLNVFISTHGLEYFKASAGEAVRGRRVINRLGAPDYGLPAPRSAAPVSDPLMMVSVSSIGGVKRVHLIARLARELAKGRVVEWHHFGSGSSAELDQELTGDVPETLVIKMWGDTPRARIQEFHRTNAVTFFVNLSESEGVPVSIMEAMNADVPVVASNVGGTSEAVIDGRSGMLVDADECERTGALARRILEALAPGGLLDRSRPRQVWQELYDADANAVRMVAHLRSLAEE